MLIRLVLIISILPISFLLAQNEHGFIGAEACGMCHKSDKQGNQLSIWKDSKHSQAFLTLQTEEANQIALEIFHSDLAEVEHISWNFYKRNERIRAVHKYSYYMRYALYLHIFREFCSIFLCNYVKSLYSSR